MEPAASKLCQAGAQQACQDEEQAGLGWPGKNKQRHQKKKKAASTVESNKVRQNPNQGLAHHPWGRGGDSTRSGSLPPKEAQGCLVSDKPGSLLYWGA